jgi:hypothetical protein
MYTPSFILLYLLNNNVSLLLATWSVANCSVAKTIKGEWYV